MITSIHSFHSISIFFKEGILPSITQLQKKVATVAMVIFVCLATVTLIYHIFKRSVSTITINEPAGNPLIASREAQPSIETGIVNIGPLGRAADEGVRVTPTGFGCVFQEIPENVSIDDYGEVIGDQTRLDFSHIELSSEKLLDYAVINYKNASCVEEARVILMGECHAFPKHQDLEVAIISQFGKHGDGFLMEGVEYKEFTPPYDSSYGIYRNISKNVRFIGWEADENIIEESSKMRDEITLKRFQLIKEISRSSKPGAAPINQEKIEKLFSEVARAVTIVFQRVFERNQFLIDSIKRSLEEYPESKIFVFAGSSHILSPEGFNLLDHMPENVKCAALLFKA